MPETITVHAPAKGFTGETVGVEFTDGTAEVPSDHPRLDYFRRHGYGIGQPPAERQAPAGRERPEPTRIGAPLRDAADPDPTPPITRIGAPLRDAAAEPDDSPDDAA